MDDEFALSLECISLKRVFFYLYPSTVKKAWNPKALTLRTVLAYAIAFHLLFFIASLAFLGFGPMMEDLALAAIAFSSYLTLYDWIVSLYMIALSGSVVFGFAMCFKFQTISFSYFMLSTFLYSALIYFTAYAYNSLDNAGGNRKGARNVIEVPEDYLDVEALEKLMQYYSESHSET